MGNYLELPTSNGARGTVSRAEAQTAEQPDVI